MGCQALGEAAHLHQCPTPWTGSRPGPSLPCQVGCPVPATEQTPEVASQHCWVKNTDRYVYRSRDVTFWNHPQCTSISSFNPHNSATKWLRADSHFTESKQRHGELRVQSRLPASRPYTNDDNNDSDNDDDTPTPSSNLRVLVPLPPLPPQPPAPHTGIGSLGSKSQLCPSLAV